MAKINPTRFLVEDFQEQKGWIGKLLSNLNSFIEEVVGAITSGLTVEDNLQQEIKEIKFQNQTNNFPLKFLTKFAINPRGLNIIYCYNVTDNTMPASSIWPKWSYGNGELKISAIDGLTSGKVYVIRVHIIYA